MAGFVKVPARFITTVKGGKRRPFSAIEAAYTYVYDQFHNPERPVNYYRKLWGWGHHRVVRFISEIQAELNEQVTNRKRTGNEQANTLKNGEKIGVTNRTQTGNEQVTNNILQIVDIENNKNTAQFSQKLSNEPAPGDSRQGVLFPAPTPEKKNGGQWLTTAQKKAAFSQFWEVFSHKVGKKRALAAWVAIKMDAATLQEILAGAEREAAARPALVKQGRTPKYPEGWLRDERWQDEPPINSDAAEQARLNEMRAQLDELDRQRATDQHNGPFAC
jgi:hypothetical protein